MPKLTKERQYLIKTLYWYGTYNTGRTRNGKSFKKAPEGVIRMKMNQKILTGNQIPRKFKAITTKDPKWMYIRVTNSKVLEQLRKV